MPKTEIDYSNTIIYKITCKNPAITDVYVGHTTNFVQRKHTHKQSCINEKATNYKCKVYEVIRNNGGWSNWKMEIINFFDCADHYAARKKEQEYFISLNATLNSIEPFPKPKVFIKKNIIIAPKLVFNCETCHITCNDSKTFEKHKISNKHLQKLSQPIENAKKCQTFICAPCDFKCGKSSNYEKHLLTRKHENLLNPNLVNSKHVQKEFECKNCKNIYKHASTLSAHRKKCIKLDPLPLPLLKAQPDNEIKILTNLVMDLVKSNMELQKQMMEICKKDTIAV
jgi:hypothetical protein